LPAEGTREAERELPSLAVVIPTTRGGADLDACLTSLVDEGYPAVDVVVVDNGCSPPLALSGAFPGVRVIRNEENRGFAVACNQGIEASTGELVLLLNDDTVLEPEALHTVVETLVSRPAWGACQAKLVLLDDPSRLDTAGSFLTSTGFLVHRGAFGRADAFTVSDEIFAAKGAALLVRRQALDQVGAFDADFFAYFEESDLCWRLWLGGWVVGFAADAVVRHRMGGTAAGLMPAIVQFHSFKNRICALVKNLGRGRLAWMLPYHVGLCLGLALWWAVRGRADLGRAILRALAWNIRHLPRTLRKRAATQRLRRVGDRELMPHITRKASLRVFFGYAARGVDA
jgi:GT2 family glycosyltransferase